MPTAMNQVDRSFFRRKIYCNVKNFSKENLNRISNLKFSVKNPTFADVLEFRFLTRQKIVGKVKRNDIGVMIFSLVHPFIRNFHFKAKFFIILPDGGKHFCSEANSNYLNNETDGKQVWRSLIKDEEIFAEENKFFKDNLLKIYIELEVTKIVKTLKQEPNDILKNYENLVNNKQFSDFKFVCSDDKTIYAHKCILMAFRNDKAKNPNSTNFFRSMFESQMKECQNGEMKVDDLDSRTMLELMSFIYAGKFSKLYEKASDLLIAADKYDIVDLKEICIEVLEQQISFDNVVEMLKLSDFMKVQKLRDNCIDFIKLHFELISQTNDYKALSADILHDIIKSMNKEHLSCEIELKLAKKSVSFNIEDTLADLRASRNYLLRPEEEFNFS